MKTNKYSKMGENRITQFETLLESFRDDYSKFVDKGNKTAATRARKSLQEMRNLAKEVRDEINQTKRDMTTA
tara:strand:+ start:182 stop:397 length:216 start_codon:yes stop_codon:yes gene_type:complete